MDIRRMSPTEAAESAIRDSHRYAGDMSASCSNQLVYDGTRYCVGKIMLRKSEAVIRTHSCGSCAAIGCIDLKPGNTRSTPASVASTSAMRGSVS